MIIRRLITVALILVSTSSFAGKMIQLNGVIINLDEVQRMWVTTDQASIAAAERAYKRQLDAAELGAPWGKENTDICMDGKITPIKTVLNIFSRTIDSEKESLRRRIGPTYTTIVHIDHHTFSFGTHCSEVAAIRNGQTVLKNIAIFLDSGKSFTAITDR